MNKNKRREGKQMTETENLKNYLFNEKKCGWDLISNEQKQEINKFSDEYIHYLNRCKTEREAVDFTKEILEKNNFINRKV